MENSTDGEQFYSITTGREEFTEAMAEYKERRFRSARHAVWNLQNDLNQALYRHKKG